MPKGIYPRKKKRAARAPNGVVEAISTKVADQRGYGMRWAQIAKFHKCSKGTAMRALQHARTLPSPHGAQGAAPVAFATDDTVIVNVAETSLRLGNISSQERSEIVNAARVLKRHGVDARILALTEVE